MILSPSVDFDILKGDMVRERKITKIKDFFYLGL